MLTQNSKLAKTSELSNAKVFNFGIPAQSTCIGATTCKAYCYASKGFYKFRNTAAAFERRLEQTKQDDFPLMMLTNIIEKKLTHVRIHDSGDFYNREYLNKWLAVIDALPHVHFYAYTKSIPLFKGLTLPENFTVIYSLGGRWDDLIDLENDRHAKIFPCLDSLQNAGYIDTSVNDLNATKENKKIGLIVH